MNLDHHVNVTIALDSLAVQRSGFGIPALLDYFPTSIFADRTRTYRSSTALAALVADGFSATGPIYLMAQALLGAGQQVTEFKVGRLATAYTQNTEIVVASSTEDAIVGVDLISPAGVEYACYHTVTSGQSLNDVAVALKAVIDGHSLDVTIAAPVSPSPTLNLVADTAGEIFYFHSLSNATINDVTADPGLATDLAAIVAEDDDWYGMLLSINSYDIVDAAATWAETQRRIYCAQSQDSDIPTSGVSDIATELKDDSRLRTYLIYSNPKNPAPLSEYPACAWMGKTFPKNAGSQTHAFKTLSGVSPSTYTPTELGYLEAKNANHYVTMAGINITRRGNMAIGATTFVDEVRLRDWLQARCQENVFQLLISNDKVPYDDSGLDLIRGAILAAYTEGARSGGLALAAFSFTALPADEQTTGDIAARIVREIKFGGLFTSAIHSVYITGNVQ